MLRLNPEIFVSRLVVASVLLVSCMAIPPGTFGQDREGEAIQLERFLQSRGLEGLLIEHLERLTARELDSARRSELASRLSELYTRKLLTLNSDEESAKGWLDKANNLLSLYPSLENPSLRIAIFHARYLAVETDFREWRKAGMEPSAREGLNEDFRELIKDLLQLERQMKTRFKSLMTQQQVNPNEITADQMAKTENVLLHANYLIGWGSYFRGVVNIVDRRRWMEQGDQHFRAFLQLSPEKNLMDAGPDWFDFESSWQSRVLIGLGMVHRGLENDGQSDHCFRLVQDYAGNSIRRELLPVWQLNSHLFLDQLSDGMDELDRFAKNESKYPVDVRTRFWVACANEGAAIQRLSSDPGRAQAGQYMLMKGLAGLATDLQSDVLRKIIDEKKIEIREADFLTRWIAGYLEFERGQSTGDPDLLESARARLKGALDETSASTDQRQLARCQYLMAWISFDQKKYEEAVVQLQQVVGRLKESEGGGDRQLAANANWLQVQALSEISRLDPRQRTRAFAAMDSLIRDFPDSPLTTRVEFEKLRLNVGSLPPAEAIRRLDGVGPEDPNYALALFEKVKVQYRIWIAARKSGVNENVERDRLLALERKHRELGDATDQRKLRGVLFVCEVYLQQEEADEQSLASLLRLASNLQGGRYGKTANELRFYEFRAARKFERMANADFHARWLIENADGSRFEQPALIHLIQQLEKELPENASRRQLQPLLQTTTRLVELAGTSREKIRTSANSRAGIVKLARLQTQLGDYRAADELYAKLLVGFPNQQTYLRESARTKMKLNDYESAGKIWRKLISGVEPGSDVWFEAKHQLIVGLSESKDNVQRDSAVKLYNQTLRLSGDLPANWKSRFEELGRRLKIVPNDQNRNNR